MIKPVCQECGAIDSFTVEEVPDPFSEDTVAVESCVQCAAGPSARIDMEFSDEDQSDE